MNSEDHQKLMARTALGDRTAFEQLYDASYGRLYAVALHLVKHPDRAEEALQDSYVKIWHNASEYRLQRGSVMTWMASIVRYRCLDFLRSQRLRDDRWCSVDDFDQLDPVAVSSEPFTPELSGVSGQLQHCLKQLDANQRHAIYLSYLQGMSHQEIVDRIEAPLGSVKSWIRRGLQRLKKCVEE